MYEKREYEFYGVNWVEVKYNLPNNGQFLLGFNGKSFIEEFYPAQIYCPYIPLYYDSSSKQI